MSELTQAYSWLPWAATVGCCLIVSAIVQRGRKAVRPREETKITHTINRAEALAVAEGYYLQPMNTCPVGVKVQLQGQGGVLVYATYDGKNKFWKAWAPLPRERKDAAS